MASEYKQFTNEGFDVEGGDYDNRPSYVESNAVPILAPPQYPYPPPNSSGYPMQHPSHLQQAAQFPQQQPGTQPQVVQVPIQQNIVHVSPMKMPNDYFALALFATLCCGPFGIVALIKSKEVRNRSAVGNYHSAAVSSLQAKRWSWTGILVGIISGLCIILYATLHSSLEYGY